MGKGDGETIRKRGKGKGKEGRMRNSTRERGEIMVVSPTTTKSSWPNQADHLYY